MKMFQKSHLSLPETLRVTRHFSTHHQKSRPLSLAPISITDTTMTSSLRSTEPVTNAPSLKTSDKGSGKTVLITGCSDGGIGSALASAFHRHGCRVFATARDLQKVEHLKKAGIEVLELDVLDEASCRKAAEWVRSAAGGTLNMLVNNSGVGESAIFPL